MTHDEKLRENRTNLLFFASVSEAGVRGASASTIITQDSEPPGLFIDFPADGADLTTEATDVAGRVSDMLSGFMGLTVTVNGKPERGRDLVPAVLTME